MSVPTYESVSFDENNKGHKLCNSNGIEVVLIDYGATIASIKIPSKLGHISIALGYDDVKGYEKGTAYFGCTVGRVCNRIAKGKFYLEGKEYSLACNNGTEHLHGGIRGFNSVLWKPEPFTDSSKKISGVRFTYFSASGEEGYPGNLKVTAVYALGEDNTLLAEFFAETDAPTPVNITNHTYWNLSGKGDILSHKLYLNADHFLPVTNSLIPTGEVFSVKNGPMDFTETKEIGSRISQVQGGYDHNFVLNKKHTRELSLVARVTADSNITLEIFSTQPGVQFYSGNFLDNIKGSNGSIYNKHGGFCLETQNFPDAVNHSYFPNSILQPGEIYHQQTIHKFIF